ncbi:MAG: DeoR family transcriptional regulator [Caulobacteraceae bacterium]|nr:DeoR family transcriptional regulator [Caulobacteraceae bacterium]
MKLPHLGAPAWLARRQLAQPEKRASGKAVAALIPDGASVFINIGTTTEEVARALAVVSGRVRLGYLRRAPPATP